MLLTLPAASGFHLTLVDSSLSMVLPATAIAIDYPDPTGDRFVEGHHGNGWRVYGSSCVKERYFSVTSSQNPPLSTSTCSLRGVHLLAVAMAEVSKTLSASRFRVFMLVGKLAANSCLVVRSVAVFVRGEGHCLVGSWLGVALWNSHIFTASQFCNRTVGKTIYLTYLPSEANHCWSLFSPH